MTYNVFSGTLNLTQLKYGFFRKCCYCTVGVGWSGIMQKCGVRWVYFKGQGFENFIQTLNISQMSRTIVAKFSRIAGLCRSCLCLRPEFCEGSNFQGIGGWSGKKLVMGDSPGKKRFDSVSNSIRFDSVQPISAHFQSGSADHTIGNSHPSVCPSVHPSHLWSTSKTVHDIAMRFAPHDRAMFLVSSSSSYSIYSAPVTNWRKNIGAEQ